MGMMGFSKKKKKKKRSKKLTRIDMIILRVKEKQRVYNSTKDLMECW